MAVAAKMGDHLLEELVEHIRENPETPIKEDWNVDLTVEAEREYILIGRTQ